MYEALNVEIITLFKLTNNSCVLNQLELTLGLFLSRTEVIIISYNKRLLYEYDSSNWERETIFHYRNGVVGAGKKS